MMRLLSTKKRIETGILRFLSQFSRIYRKGERYKEERIGERADPCLTPTLTSDIGEEKPFHI